MDSYPYPTRPFARGSNGSSIMDMARDGMNTFDIVEGQSLDSIVAQNDKENRRRSMPVYARTPHMQMGSPDTRRVSMMNFGDPSGSNVDAFQFDMSAGTGMHGIMRSNPAFPRTTAAMQNERAPADLAINTQFQSQNSPFSTMAAPGSAYASPMHQKGSLDMDMSPYPNGLPMSLDMDESLAMMPSDMNMFPNNQFNSPMMESPITQEFVGPMSAAPQDNKATAMQPTDQYRRPSLSITPEARSGVSSFPSRATSQEHNSLRSNSRPESEQRSSNNVPTRMTLASLKQQQPTAQDPGQDLPKETINKQLADFKSLPWTAPAGGLPSTMHSNPHTKSLFKSAYSSTGFDMLGVLMRIATRPDPQVDIGAVDLSCAFVVCDAEMDDIPIVYCSENFERLTGYTRHMILGRNCRFLQSPDGKVESGVKRNYVDDESVQYLKNMVASQSEAQISLINYRRGGQPFMNLLTVIPIAWELGGPMKYFVGFQVDLVEQPGAMTDKNSDGSYRVNYQRGMSIPSYVFNDHHKPQPDQGQTISKDEVSSVLASYGGSGDTEMARRIWDKVLLENTDDIVHVLSLKGLFLYLSPASNTILEYDPSELVGTALSSVCHPSDIVPVTRELKETTNGASVDVVFRIRRKKSGYMWFEGHGSLHTEQGKGRKCIILVGRERPVYTLSKTIVRESGGVGDNELWTKMSTSGMFLFVSSNVRQLLDKQPEDLIGTSIQSLMRADSKTNFGRILELARGGRKGEVKHEMINKRGQVLQAFTTIYPGDATEGQKPTFVVGQTRLLKYSRNTTASRPSMYTNNNNKDRDSSHSGHTQYSGATPVPGSLTGNNGPGTPMTAGTHSRFVTTEESPATFAGHNGLLLGHQDQSLASDDNVFDELKTTRSTSWQYELRQMEKRNRYLAEEVQNLLAAKKKRKRRKGVGQMQKDCANCHTRTTPEWRRGPSGNRDLCNSCGLRWAKQQGRMSPRTSSAASERSKKSVSPRPHHGHPSHQNHQTVVPNAIPEQQASVPSMLAQSTGTYPQQGSSSEPYAAEAAQTEVAASQGFVPPPMIDKGSEPE